MSNTVGLNKKVFIDMVDFLDYYDSSDNGFISTEAFRLSNYDYDYSHAIISYMKKRGFFIHRTNWNT